jgi:hypothetical protein
MNIVFCSLFFLFLDFCFDIELIGLDSIFGAFLFGLCIPRGSKLFHQCNEYIETYILTFTLPLYFALSGIKTDITTISTKEEGGMVVLITVLAVVSKIVGCGCACIFSGLNMRESAVVGTFMNCKGLVELIVLNVGLSAKILTTRTFSVMVLMAVCTTFITSPVVEFLYPPHMRELDALEQHRKDVELVQIESSMNGEIDLKTLPNRIGVIIENLQQMQELVNLLKFFLPYENGAELSTTLMHFYEPTHTSRDSFIGINEQGRLIRVDEEPTHIATALRLTDHDASLPKAELLPLASFCNAFDIPVNAFRVQGDPHDYPAELSSMASSNDLSLLFFPFQNHSQFAQTLFWNAMKVAHLPTLVIANMESALERELQVMETTSEKQPRRRSSTFSGLVQELEQPTSPTLYTNIPLDAVPIHRRRSVTSRVMKKASSPKRNKHISIVVVGLTSDIILLSLIARFAQNKSNEITVYVTADSSSFPMTIVEEIQSLKSNAEKLAGSVKFESLRASSQDSDSLVMELQTHVYDLLLMSYVEPSEDPASEQRLQSASDHVAVDERITARMVTGMPNKCVYSTLAHPELGVIGSRLYDCNHMHSSLMVILHEPLRVRKESIAVPPTAAGVPVVTSDNKSVDGSIELTPRQDKLEILV